ncbi:hypothetical protein [Maribellus sp. YY47]|uniref:hypothetical protein n=1 Tax=Maribellus sp. YY47 TaxID=2929486 RepID=UPI0020018949|nr:hypothetical protein [Maribellus sp. YY47]MCK3685463.1 hypothetical protein [Maribellus sp. YY47]
MRQKLCILIVSFFMTSCATILNQPYTNLTVYTTAPGVIVHNGDTVKTIENKANFQVDRKKEPICFVSIADSLTKTYQVEPRNSFMYWSNVFCNYGLGLIVDAKNPKRYSYPPRIYINSANTIGGVSKYGDANNKGEWLLHLSLPHINSFCLTPEDEGTKLNTGFWGLTIGLDYYHSKNQFINLGFSGVSDFFIPFPAAVDISGEYELMSSRYVSLSNNHKLKRFSVGYGFSYARNAWDFRYYDRFDPLPPTREPVKKSGNALGLIFPNYFQFWEYFNIGVIYRPTFYRPDMTDKFKYEHLISIDFAWKIRLKD